MIFAEPPPSSADWRFRLFGIPVRVHYYFWIAGLLTSSVGGQIEPQRAVLWIVVLLVSILVHELGHAFTQRHYGGRPWIVLHGFGGLAVCSDCDRRPWAQILISLAGPGAGFLLAGVVIAVLAAAGLAPQLSTQPQRDWVSLGPLYLSYEGLPNPVANHVVLNLLYVNIWWGLMNLLPVYPLDGGHVARELATLRGSARRGIERSIWLGITVAVAVAVYAATHNRLYLALLFGYLAYTNYQTLGAYQRYRN